MRVKVNYIKNSKESYQQSKCGCIKEDIDCCGITRDGNKSSPRLNGFCRGGRPDYWYEAFYKGYFLSYKYDLLKKTDMKQVKNRVLPSDAKIVSFHGGPKQHKVDENWLREHWGPKLSYSEPKKKSRRG